MSKNNWNSSVNELIAIFRGALNAIIPWLEKAKIKWNEEDSYDDWDNIANTLYENIVCSSLIGEVIANYHIAKYNFHYDNYSHIDFILVGSTEYQNTNLAFISFQSILSPLDSIKVAILDNSYKTVDYITLEEKNIEFKFIRNNNGKREVIDTIEVMI